MLFPTLTEVLDPAPHSAALNMAIDEVLLRTAVEPLLRVYRWERPAVSFGYFGKWAEIAPVWPGRDLVRRWTGGGVVEHGEDLTYTLIVPREHPFSRLSAAESYRAIHETIARLLSVAQQPLALASATATRVSSACFENAAQHDVLADGRKVAGAAQRRTRDGLLHQGSIQGVPVHDSLGAPHLCSVFSTLAQQRELTERDLALAAQLVQEKYASAAWLRRF